VLLQWGAAVAGHLDRLKHMYGYIKRHPDGAILLRFRIPDHEIKGVPIIIIGVKMYDDIKEELPYDMPIPKGKMLRTINNVQGC
jgi:hypothetical protein